jgi:[acyl-carrier-protein] S-malonyltransferase
MKKYAITFPGQGSQSVGMFSQFNNNDLIQKTFKQASDVLSVDLWNMVNNENESINHTVNTQPIMLCAGYATEQILKDEGIDNPSFYAGHSLGEITALVCSNVISFEDGLKIVKKRAELMQSAVPEGVGAMAAILGLDDETVKTICVENSGDLIIEAVNFNSPGQVVVAGHKALIEQLIDKFKQAGAKRALLLPVSVPSHCALMKDAANDFENFLNQFNFNSPLIPVVHNVDGASNSGAEDIKKAIVKQLYSPVQWTKTIDYLSD